MAKIPTAVKQGRSFRRVMWATLYQLRDDREGKEYIADGSMLPNRAWARDMFGIHRTKPKVRFVKLEVREIVRGKA